MRSSSLYRIPRRWLLAGLFVALVLVVLTLEHDENNLGTISLAASSQTQTRSETGELAKGFRMASRHWAVPLPVVMAIGYVESHWEQRDGQPSLDKGYGIMHLVDRPGGTLQQAVALTGLGAEGIKSTSLANIEAGAAILSDLSRKLNLTAKSNSPLESWFPVVAEYSGATDLSVRDGYAREVFRVIREGVRKTLSTGETLVLDPSQVDSLPSPQHPAPDSDDYPSALWVPADPNNYRVGRPYGPLNFIIIHDTEGSYSSAINWFQNPSSGVSAHYVIRSSDGEITQMVHEADTAYHAGNWDYNVRAVGIEHEGYESQPGWYTEPMYQASSALVRNNADFYGIKKDRAHIIGHYQVPNQSHTDPGSYWDWNHYMSLLRRDAARVALVDNTDSGFQAIPSQIDPQHYWYIYSGGYNGSNAYITSSVSNQQYSTNSGTWTAYIPSGGYYDIYAFIPRVNNGTTDTSNAAYKVYSADGMRLAPVSQRAITDVGSGSWAHLGDFRFNSNSNAQVSLDDYTGESDLNVAFDAVMWIPVYPLVPTSTPAPTNTSTPTPTPQPPPAPVLVAPSEGVHFAVCNTVTLSWNSALRATEYRAQWATDPSFSPTAIVGTSSWSSSTSYQILSGLPSDTYYWRAQARNQAGESPWSSYRSFVTEPNRPPNTPQLVSPSDGAWYNYHSVLLQWSDPGDPDNCPYPFRQYNVEVYRGAQFIESVQHWGNIQWTSTVPSDDDYQWRVQAYDGALTSGWSVWRTVRIDATPPDTTIITGTSGDIGVGTASFTWTGSDNRTPSGSLQYSYGLNGSWSAWSGSTSATFNGLGEGQYTFQVKARDLAGNEDPSPASRSFYVDVTPPDTTITVGPSGTCLPTSAVTFGWTGSDTHTPTNQLVYSYWLEGYDAGWSSFGAATSRTYTGLTDGTYTFHVKARDGVGHEDLSPATRTFTIDTTPPTGSVLINGGDSTTNQVAASLDIVANDGPLGCGVSEMRLANDQYVYGPWQSMGSPVEWFLPPYNEVTATVYLQLKDVAGNISQAIVDTIYVNFYPPRPASSGYQLGARAVASDHATASSESYRLRTTTGGQPAAGKGIASQHYRLESGFQGAWLTEPHGRPAPQHFGRVRGLIASGGTASTSRSQSYQMQGTVGQPTLGGQRASANYRLTSGYWSNSGTQPSPPARTLVGHTTWQGRPAQPHALQQLPLTMTLKLGSAETNYAGLTTDASGFFTVNVGSLPNGTYNWRVKSPKYLANAGAVALTGSVSMEMGLMKVGDANNDNAIAILDFNVMKPTIGRGVGDPNYDDRADFNGDNVVNVSDFTLLKVNFGYSGAPPLHPSGK